MLLAVQEKMSTPLIVYDWKDSEPTNAIGWYVVDTIINNVTGGGIFMSPTATQQEVADIAANMTKKFTVTSPQIGGGKGGIRFDPSDPRAQQVLRRYIIALKLIFQTFVVTAGDLGVDDAFVEQVFHEDLGLPTCQSALASKIAQVTQKPSLAGQLTRIIPFPANDFFPLIEGAVGYGCMASIRTVATHIDLPMQNMKAIIQGFGAVGSSLAYYLYEAGCKVVAICDKDGYIWNRKGLHIPNLLKLRQAHAATVRGTQHQEVCKNIVKTACQAHLYDSSFDADFEGKVCAPKLMEFLMLVGTADVFCPCATRYAVTPTVANILTTINCVSIVASGANNPFGTEDGLHEDRTAINSLVKDGVVVIRDAICNSGTAQLFHRGLSTQFDLTQSHAARTILDECAKPICDFLELALRQTKTNPSNLWMTSTMLIEHRVSHPIAMEDMDKPPLMHPVIVHQEEKKQPNAEVVVPIIPKPKARYAYPRLTTFVPGYENLDVRVATILEVGEECVEPSELADLMRSDEDLVAYDGFEPSGRIHVAQALMKKAIVNKMTACGFTYIFWIADFFAMLNLKQGGDMTKIHLLGQYFQEVWKACGMNMERVRFLWAYEEILKRPEEYFKLMLDISTKFSLARVRKCSTALGREKEEDSLQSSQIVYPILQCADIFFLGVKVCQLGTDQRKVNMLARDFVDDKSEYKKPVVLSHKMLSGLGKGQGKMSKSNPDSAIYMDDDEPTIHAKIRKAYCPLEAKDNPCLEYFKFIIFPNMSAVLIEVSDHDTGARDKLTFDNYADLEAAYLKGEIYPNDLKTSLALHLNALIEPVRNHFCENEKAKKILAEVRAKCC